MLNVPAQVMLIAAGIGCLLLAAGVRIPPFTPDKNFKRWLAAVFGCIFILLGLALEVWKSPHLEGIAEIVFRSDEESASRLRDLGTEEPNILEGIGEQDAIKRNYVPQRRQSTHR